VKLTDSEIEVFIPDCVDPQVAMKRTTDLCFAAHPDDIEIMAYGPIAACFDDPERFFGGCVVGNGAGSPRSDTTYKDCTDEQMKYLRISEQKKAAQIGNYSLQVLFGLDSKQIKNGCDTSTVDMIEKLLLDVGPDIVYTHNLADKHDTHVAVALRVIEAARRLPLEKRPRNFYSLEVWRGLDWLCDEDKVIFDTTPYPDMAAAILEVYESQIAGGKRYDSATLGRRMANATFFESHETDNFSSLSYGLDITELIRDRALDPEEFIQQYISNFSKDVTSRLEKLR